MMCREETIKKAQVYLMVSTLSSQFLIGWVKEIPLTRYNSFQAATGSLVLSKEAVDFEFEFCVL